MSDRHRVFVSYYHKDDQHYKELFERRFSNIYDIYVSESVKMGDIDNTKLSNEQILQKIRDEHLRDSTVTVVLIGAHTWQRKFVDWEIGASIRQTNFNPRSGLLGILLPTYPRPPGEPNKYSRYTIPPRLYDNVACGFAKIYDWNDNPSAVQACIHEAFKRRNQDPPPDNSCPAFGKNRSGERWFD